MNAPQDEPIVNIRRLDQDGDECTPVLELVLWDFCVKARQFFGTNDVIFKNWPTEDGPDPVERIQFFVPRDHPRVADIEAVLIKAVTPICHELATSR